MVVFKTLTLLFSMHSKKTLISTWFRCDSAETASLLLDQMNRLINQPDNQRKFVEIENRLQVIYL